MEPISGDEPPPVYATVGGAASINSGLTSAALPTRKYLVLAVCCSSLFIVGLDSTVVNIALPTIQRDFNTSVSGLQWTVDAYTLVLASLFMLSGSLADRFGRRRVFRTGLCTFLIGSLLCSVAPNLSLLVAFRMIQALGGTMLNPVAMSIITNVFIDPREKARALGMWSGTFGLSMALGPPVGGLLVDSALGWRAIFWINIPIGLLVLFLTTIYVPESKAVRPRRLDPIGQILVICVLSSLMYAIIEGPRAGWASIWIDGLFAVSLAAATALVAYERKRQEPLLELRFFRSIPFSGATMVAVAGFSTLGAFLLLNTLYLQSARGYSPSKAGLLTLPMAGMTLISGPISGRLVGRFGPRPSFLISGFALGTASLVLALAQRHAGLVPIVADYGLFGFGFAMANPAITNSALSGMPRARAGVAGAINSTSRQVGQSLGVAIAGSILASRLHGSIRTGFVSASAPAWWLLGGIGYAIVLLGFAITSERARRTQASVAGFLD